MSRWGLFATILLLFSLEIVSSLNFLQRRPQKGSVTPRTLLHEIARGSNEGRVLELIDEITLEKSNRRESVRKLTGAFEVHTTTGQPSWTKWSSKLSVKDKDTNKNYQMFGENNNFINLSEYGFGCFATASGVYEKSLEPNTFVAEVDAVTIHFGNKIELPLRVKGKGVISLLYSDKELRIIESEEGARAVQRPVPAPEKYQGLLESRGIIGL